jgi:hypothetical protein
MQNIQKIASICELSDELYDAYNQKKKVEPDSDFCADRVREFIDEDYVDEKTTNEYAKFLSEMMPYMCAHFVIGEINNILTSSLENGDEVKENGTTPFIKIFSLLKALAEKIGDGEVEDSGKAEDDESEGEDDESEGEDDDESEAEDDE